MNIIIPVYVLDENKVEIILDQLYVTMESYYFHGNTGTFIIYTNNNAIKKGISLYKNIYERDIIIVSIDFEKVWNQLNLPINNTKTRIEYIISKFIISFIFDDDYLIMDWDILTTGKIEPNYTSTNKLRFFNPKFYDSYNLRQNSIIRKLVPENETIGTHHWVNSGMIYSPARLSLELIKEYWEMYHGISDQVYRGIYLFDIIGDELIYNLMLLNKDKRIEECRNYNINTVFRNFYYTFGDIHSMFEFGNNFPYVYNVHFAGGHVKPYNVIVDENYNLSFVINTERYLNNKKSLRFLFDMGEHRAGNFHYNALIFSIIWQYTRYSIREKLGLTKEKISERYHNFFYNNLINE